MRWPRAAPARDLVPAVDRHARSCARPRSSWIHRRFGVHARRRRRSIACVGTKELVASLPHLLHLRDPSRDTVLYPAISYPTYAMGAELAGLRAVPVPLDDAWQLDLARVSDADAERALRALDQRPGQPDRGGRGR